MSVRFGRSIRASATDVTVLGTDPDGTPLAQADFLEVQLALPALFDKLVDIELARIEGATLNLEVDDQGRGNWPTFGYEDPPQDDRGDDSDQTENKSNVALRIAEAQVSGQPSPSTISEKMHHALSIDRFDGLMSAEKTEARVRVPNERALETTRLWTASIRYSPLPSGTWIGAARLAAQFQATGHLEALITQGHQSLPDSAHRQRQRVA